MNPICPVFSSPSANLRGSDRQDQHIDCSSLIVITVINVLVRIKASEHSKVLEDKADTDLLTDLNNKMATERKIREYMEQYPDKQGVLFVLDVDNFKKINDTMGHALRR